MAALWGGGAGWPGFTAVAQSAGRARFIAPDVAQVQRIVQKHAFLKPMAVPAGSYPGQAEAIASVGSWSFVIARASLQEDAAYRVARALHRGQAAVAQRLAAARETTPANTVAAAASIDLIHAGVQRHLREAGLLR